MISHLKGAVIYKDEKSIIVDVAGIGYRVFATSRTLDAAHVGKEIALWTHFSVHEDSQALYGFVSKEDLDLFELLVSVVSGVGPKSALNILNVSSAGALRKAVATGDTAHLTRVSGIGKKLADKIILELKGKLDAEESGGVLPSDEADALEALKSIGFNHSAAREALEKVDKKITNTSERVKKALKILGK
ncbi:MAG TPA: Holliday junction branch migration protein RuvA [Candidatus Paceibacterota bacterium]|nr:Holliday junction branch migration protein RuvA [Candidatus Paceibacterota bacterium]